ncbi:MAG: ABC transporter substrate-binding protein [Hyphomicrobiaceae bacterium]
MRRREFILLTGCICSWSLVAHAQQDVKKVRIGQVIGPGEAAASLASAFEQSLVALGYTDGKNISLLTRPVPPQLQALEQSIQSFAPEIDLLVVWGTVRAVAAKRSAPNIPTVFLSVGAPVDIGLVESLARPGGNMTGVTFEAATETYAKRLQILKELIPNLRHVAVLRASGDANVPFAMRSIERAAQELALTIASFDVASVNDLEATFDAMARAKPEGLLVVAGALTYEGGKRIAELALQYQFASCHAFKETVAAGGLISLGPDLLRMASQGAGYVAKIIQGAQPGQLSVEQPARYELHLNAKTARVLGITVPSTLLARADEVIE